MAVCRRPRRLGGGKGGEGREAKEPKNPAKRIKKGLPPLPPGGAVFERWGCGCSWSMPVPA